MLRRGFRNHTSCALKAFPCIGMKFDLFCNACRFSHMSLNPAFDQFPKEAALIGRMVTSFGELELTFSMLAGTALKDQSLALRAVYRGRSTGGRIDLVDVI